MNERKEDSKSECKAGIGMLLKKGEAYYDVTNDKVRFRKLLQEPLKEELYETTEMELQVEEHMKESLDPFRISVTKEGEYVFKHSMKMPNPKYGKWSYYGTLDYVREYDKTDTELRIDQDGAISFVKCNCKSFNIFNTFFFNCLHLFYDDRYSIF